MNLLADESVDGSIVERLRLDGHRVLYVAEMQRSVDDEVVFELANSEKAKRSNGLTISRKRRAYPFVWRNRCAPIGGCLRLSGRAFQQSAPTALGGFYSWRR